MATKKFILAEKDIPQAWYNVIADMPNKPMSPLNPATKSPLAVEDLYPIFAEELCKQELNTSDAWIEIPEEVRDMYKIWRPTPLVRALGLEKALATPAHIYFKNESVSPVGSHKLNSAIPQAYYCKKQGITNITTETGAGQWGAALSLAAKAFGLELAVYMVKVSFHQKPYRRSIMQTFGAQVIASPSMSTKAGRKILTDHPNYQGSLGTAISEAIELAMSTPNCKYTLGSVLNHVSLHQTVIGLEAEKQMEMAGEYPDIVIACFGGGSNFSGISFPFLRHKYTLGHNFSPANIHAGGLRYHGAGTIVSQLKKDGLLEAVDIEQLDTFKAATLFAQCEGIIPAPESSHAIAATIQEALRAKEEGKEKCILFNLSGHGLIDMAAYDQYLAGDLLNYNLPEEEIAKNIKELEKII